MSAKPLDLSREVEVNPRLVAALHSVRPDGRVMHSFTRDQETAEWVCACGERRDRFGRPL